MVDNELPPALVQHNFLHAMIVNDINEILNFPHPEVRIGTTQSEKWQGARHRNYKQESVYLAIQNPSGTIISEELVVDAAYSMHIVKTQFQKMKAF